MKQSDFASRLSQALEACGMKAADPAYAPMVYSGPQLDDVQIEGWAVGWTYWVG